MEVQAADSLLSNYLKGNILPRRPDQQYNISSPVRDLLDTNHDGKISRSELRAGLLADRVSFDPKTRQIIANRSKMTVNGSIFPMDKSPTFDTVEQCMEFVKRYFKEDREKAKADGKSFDSDFGPQHNISDDVRSLAKGELKKDGYTAYLNGDITPPRAGDILVAESEDHSTFHVALVTSVDRVEGKWQATVYQANVPYNTNSHKLEDHTQAFPISYKDGKWKFDRLPTTKWAYDEDMDVVGWIHPSCEKSLPEAASCN